jgi:hypothetical protein
MVKRVEEDLLSGKLAQPDDRIVIVLGAPLASGSPTNSLRLHREKSKPGRVSVSRFSLYLARFTEPDPDPRQSS